jgi:nucleoid-associated protein YgaU
MRRYTATDGETLEDIASRELGSARLWMRLYAWNAGVCPRQVKGTDSIASGIVLLLPPATNA